MYLKIMFLASNVASKCTFFALKCTFLTLNMFLTVDLNFKVKKEYRVSQNKIRKYHVIIEILFSRKTLSDSNLDLNLTSNIRV